MISEAFLNFFQNYQTKETNNFYFRDFFKETNLNLNESRVQLKYSASIDDLKKQACDTFLINLKLNEFFNHNDGYEKSVIDQLCNLFRNSKQNLTGDSIAQILFLIHVSNSNLEQFYYAVLFYLIDSIKIIENQEEYPFNVELNQLFQNLINNNMIQTTIQKVIKEVLNKDLEFDFNAIKLSYFKSKIIGLTSYIGINEIYISNYELNHFYQTLDSVKYNESDKIALLQLEFTRLVVNSLAHLALRSTLDDFNLRQPNLEDELPNDLSKVGIYAEKELFNCNINWTRSAQNEKFNIKYCTDRLNNILLNQEFKFDCKKAGAIKNDCDPIIITADISLEANLIEIE